MTPAKRRRAADNNPALLKAARLADAQQKLVELADVLDSRQQLDREIRDLRAAEVSLITMYPNAIRVAAAQEHLDRRLQNCQSALEERKEMAKGFPAKVDICSQIQEIKSVIPDLSTPTYFDRVVKLGPPSAAERQGLYAIQTKEQLLYDCCFPADAQPPLPLTLACHLFGEFLDDFTNVSAPLNDDVCNFVVELCFDVLGRMQKFENEAEFRKAFNLKMGGFLGLTVAIDEVTCGTPMGVANATTDSTVQVGDKWTALGKLKLEKGCTLAQGLQSFAIYVGSLDAETQLLPCFFVEVIGPTIRIGGFVSFENVAWQPLTPFLNCFYTEHDRTDMVTLCRAMRALKKGVIALGSYYNEAPSTVTRKDIPYPLQGRDTVRIGNRLVFIVTCDARECRIFKYCRQYGEEVHRIWAQAGFAPHLYACKPVVGGWLEVEMQYLEGWIPSSLLETMDEAARDELQAAISAALKKALAI